MKFSLLTSLALAVSTVSALSVPEVDALDRLEQPHVIRSEILAPEHALEKRKGGGGKGGGGGRGGGGGGGNRGPPARALPNSNAGGRTSAGSGAPRAYGGGYYGGGAAVPYKSGSRTPKGLVAGALLAPTAVLLIMPGIWLWSVYPYYLSPYSFRNRTRNATDDSDQSPNNNAKRQEELDNMGVNVTLPVVCLCQEFLVCGCDDNTDSAYLDSLVGNGSYEAMNKSLVTVSMVNDTETLVINGTLPNGTTAPGGTDDAAAGLRVNQYAGYGVMVMIVLSTVALL